MGLFYGFTHHENHKITFFIPIYLKISFILELNLRSTNLPNNQS